LHPIAFAEPFGLSVVESMLCGTPVVAYARGSMPELVDEGVTGVLAHGVDSAVAGVERAVGFDRSACRQTAERRFSVDRMVDDYIEVYEGVLRDR
jgi:glycosyltransferase involved in cell wall biosynthesis